MHLLKRLQHKPTLLNALRSGRGNNAARQIFGAAGAAAAVTLSMCLEVELQAAWAEKRKQKLALTRANQLTKAKQQALNSKVVRVYATQQEGGSI